MTSGSKPHVLVLGGGIGGVVVARLLKEKLRDDVRVTVVDKKNMHLFPPSLIWVMTGEKEPDDIMAPLEGLRRHGIEFIQAEVKAIDPDNRRVDTSRGSLEYDYLVVALGSEPRPELMDADDTVCAPWTVSGALKCRELLSRVRGKSKVLVGAWSWPYKCPPAPFEAAFILKYLFSAVRGVPVEVTVAHFWQKPMEPFGPKMVSAFEAFLDRYGVEFRGGLRVVRARGGVAEFEGGEKLEYDVGVFAPPHTPPKPVAESPLASEKLGGYMEVDKVTLRHPKYREVFGVGDIISPSLGIGMAGVFAHFEGEYVATQIVDEIRGVYSGSDYNRSGICVMDLGFVGAAVYCDFADKIMGRSEYPDCAILGGMKAFRVFKYAFERLWFARWL
ncbi:MAG: NAD(P)/FAD-dependent oxidoreductase [Desulfurococcales archaeon]|nr:NAD(P)/FAD-dependent oxidoreductase [Desulfurococcales archaeon]